MTSFSIAPYGSYSQVHLAVEGWEDGWGQYIQSIVDTQGRRRWRHI